MGGVTISGNIKKESVRINPRGDVIDARTKQVISPVEPEFVPPAVPVETLSIQAAPPTSKIDEMINRKIEEIVAKKIEEALSKL